MATLKDFRDERLRKLADLKELGINPYPAETLRTHTNQQVLDNFDTLEGKEVSVVGRITGIRKFGKIAFVVIRDQTASLQLFLSEVAKPQPHEGDEHPQPEILDTSKGLLTINELPLLDTGDFVEATGLVIKSKTGEISVEVKQFRLI